MCVGVRRRRGGGGGWRPGAPPGGRGGGGGGGGGGCRHDAPSRAATGRRIDLESDRRGEVL